MSPPSFTSGLDAGSSSEVSELDSSSGSEFSLDSPPSSTSGMDVSSDFELPATDAAASGVSAGGSDDFGITEEMAMADAAGPGSHTSGEEEVFSLDELEAKEEEPEPPKKKKKK